jgi:GNAT superfamily N-acetyltransferase
LEHEITYLTAETAAGRQALDEVMAHSYAGDVDSVPPAWARVRLADGVPVAFILVDPDRCMDALHDELPFAFICDVATREDRRGEGHFRGLMEDTFARLREDGHFLVVTHGRYQLYRRFGFDVFTYHSGVFVTPEQIERQLGNGCAPADRDLLVTMEHRALLPNLLVVSDIRSTSLAEHSAALRAAATLARERGCSRILFEHPAAPSYGSRYPVCTASETAFAALARTCGAQVIVQGADPEAGTIPDADWIKVLDTPAFLQVALRGFLPVRPLPSTLLTIETDTGTATLICAAGGVALVAGAKPLAERVRWPSAALAQLVTGYRPAEVLALMYDTPLSSEARDVLGTLFPPRWRFSRNESWIYRT